MKHVLHDLFLHSEGQLFNVQNDDGSYRTIDIPSSEIDAALVKHLASEHTLAARLLQLKTNLVKAGCVDLDLKPNQTITQLFQLATHLQAQFRSHGLIAYVEFSGRRGIHVWVFSAEPIPAKTMRQAIMHICLECKYDPEEIFPKGDTMTDDGRGSGYAPIKLPLGVHRKSGNRSFFFKDGFNLDSDEWPTPEVAAASNDEIKGYVRNDPALIAQVAALYNEPEKAQGQHAKVSFEGLAEDEHPHCIEFLRKQGAPTDLDYNSANLTLARYGMARGFSAPVSSKLAGEMAKNTPSTHPTAKTEKERIENFDSALRSAQGNPEQYGWSCGYIRCSKALVSQGGCLGWDCPYSQHRSEEEPIKASATTCAVESDVIDFVLANPKDGLEIGLSIMPPLDGFLDKVHRKIWELSIAVGSQGSEIRTSTLLSELDTKPVSEDLKEKVRQRITRTINSPCSKETFQEYLTRVREIGLRVRIIRHLNSAKSELTGTNVPLESSLDTLISKSHQLWSQSNTEVKPLKNVLGDLLNDLLYSTVPMIPSPFQRLNTLLNGGLGLGKLGVIASPPGGGKTTFLSQIADHPAKLGIPVLYVSYEMGKAQLLIYSLARNGGINSGDIETRKWERLPAQAGKALQDKLAVAITEVTTSIAPRTTIVEADQNTTTSVIKGLVHKVRREAGLTDDQPVLVVIDYLQLMPCGEEKIDQGTNETIRVSRVATQLKQLARDTNTAVLAISDINKAAYEEAMKSGQLNMGALRDSFKIAHAADQVYLLQTSTIQVKTGKKPDSPSTPKDQLQLYEENFRTDARVQAKIRSVRQRHPLNASISSTYANLRLLKNRGGRIGSTLYLYEKAFHRFVELDLGDQIETREETTNDPF